MVVGAESASSKLDLQSCPSSLTGRDYQPTSPRYCGTWVRAVLSCYNYTHITWLIGAVPCPMSRLQTHLHHAHPSSLVVVETGIGPLDSTSQCLLHYGIYQQNATYGIRCAQPCNSTTNSTFAISRL